MELTINFIIKRHHVVSVISLMEDTKSTYTRETILSELKYQLRLRGEQLSTVRRTYSAEQRMKQLFPEWEDN